MRNGLRVDMTCLLKELTAPSHSDSPRWQARAGHGKANPIVWSGQAHRVPRSPHVSRVSCDGMTTSLGHSEDTSGLKMALYADNRCAVSKRKNVLSTRRGTRG